MFTAKCSEPQVGISNGTDEGSGVNVVNYIISPELFETKIKDGASLLNPLNDYLRNVGIFEVSANQPNHLTL